jgi:hypothetical protein
MEAIRLGNVMNRRSFLSTLALGMLALGGCDTTNAFVLSDMPGNSEAPCQVIAWWERSIVVTSDSVNNGKPLPGLAGRIYLFDQNVGAPLVGDGSLVVGLFDDTPHPGVTGPVEVHEWKIDAVTLKRLLRKDVLGWGYTVFLPWPEDKPQFTHLQLKVRYNQPNKAPLFTESGPISLETPPPPGQPAAPNQPPQVTHAAPVRGQ